MSPNADNTPLQPFSDPAAVSRYAEGPLRQVPGYEHLLRMTHLLIEERTGANADLLVLGAGGGLETLAFATSHPAWTFVGVDPSAEMLRLAATTLEPVNDRVQLVRGYIDDAPQRRFDAATCLLTFHFIEAAERLRTARAVRDRLRPGAPFVVAHMSIPGAGEERSQWFARYVAFGRTPGTTDSQLEERRKQAETHPSLHVLDPADDVRLLVQAGFHDVTAFYQAFNWRGWVAYA